MTKHTLNLLLAYEPKVPKSPEPLQVIPSFNPAINLISSRPGTASFEGNDIVTDGQSTTLKGLSFGPVNVSAKYLNNSIGNILSIGVIEFGVEPSPYSFDYNVQSSDKDTTVYKNGNSLVLNGNIAAATTSSAGSGNIQSNFKIVTNPAGFYSGSTSTDIPASAKADVILTVVLAVLPTSYAQFGGFLFVSGATNSVSYPIQKAAAPKIIPYLPFISPNDKVINIGVPISNSGTKYLNIGSNGESENAQVLHFGQQQLSCIAAEVYGTSTIYEPLIVANKITIH